MARIKKEVAIRLPGALATGDYAIRGRLLRGATVVNERVWPVYVAAESDRVERVANAARVAVYEAATPAAGDKALPGPSTRQVLERAGVARPVRC